MKLLFHLGFVFVVILRATPSSAQQLLLALYPEVVPGSAQETMGFQESNRGLLYAKYVLIPLSYFSSPYGPLSGHFQAWTLSCSNPFQDIVFMLVLVQRNRCSPCEHQEILIIENLAKTPGQYSALCRQIIIQKSPGQSHRCQKLF